MMPRLSAALLLLLAAPDVHAQVTLPGSGSYFENFDSLGSGLPTGWTVRIDATATNPGLNVSAGFQNNPTSWGTSTAQFANYASALNPSANGMNTTNDQNAMTDRALGLRPISNFGDPGGAFTFQLSNTNGYRDFNLSFSAQLLNVQDKNSVYTVRYGLGTNPTTFTNLGTISTETLNGGSFGEDSFALGPSVLTELNDRDETVWIQIVALSNSTGSGSRDVFAIDSFELTYTPVPEPGTVLAFAVGGLGLAGLVRQRLRTRAV